MHPPFTLAADSTFCSSLDSCSSHGFSSLQSPSAFFSNDSSPQIDPFQPLSLDSAELCGCHLLHCCGETALDITQVDSVSQSNLNILTSEEGSLLHHTDPHKPFCPFHSSPSRNCEAKDLGLDCIPRGSLLLQESSIAEHSISLPSCPSSLSNDTKSSAFLSRYNKKKQAAFSEFNPRFLSSSPDPDLQDSSDVYSNSGYAFHSQSDKTQQFESFETHSKTNDITCIDAHTRHSCHKTSCIMPLEVVSSALTSSVHFFPTSHTDADDKENFIEAHINGSGKRRVQLLENLTPPFSVGPKSNHIREGKKEALQEVHENNKTLFSPCKEMFINSNAVDEASKENVSPCVFEQAHKRVGGVKIDSNGWMCPKDGKKNFKPKPRQLLLDKWLARQR